MKHLISVCFSIIVLSVMVSGQGNGFSFQGHLNDGTNPANGAYDLQFKLYDAVTGGNQIGPLVPRANTVLINGNFSVVLDFGATAFNNPASIFIEISVKPNGSPNAYTVLGPRQQLTVVPYAVRAMNATNADNATHAVNAQNAVSAANAIEADHSSIADASISADTANNALNLAGHLPSEYARLDFANGGGLQASGDMVIGGNARHVSPGANGLVKGMLVVTTFGQIARCYNSVTNSSTGNCGFTVTVPTSGVFRIDVGFLIADRFLAVTAQYIDSGGTGVNNSGVNYRAFNNTTVEIFTFASGNSADTQPRPFTVVIY